MSVSSQDSPDFRRQRGDAVKLHIAFVTDQKPYGTLLQRTEPVHGEPFPMRGKRRRNVFSQIR